MRSLILIALLFVSCAKTSKNNKTIEEVVDTAPTDEVVKPLEVGEFEEEVKNTVINTARKVLFSENLKEITRIKLEIENVFKQDTSYKSVTHTRKVCYHNAYSNVPSQNWGGGTIIPGFYIPYLCTDQASYNASPARSKYPSSAKGYLHTKKLNITYRVLNPWVNKKFKDDLTLEDLGIELFINDRFIDVSKKDISVNTDSGDVNKLLIEFNLPQAEEGNLKVTAKPVYATKTVRTGHISPTLYSCTPDGFSNTPAWVLSTSYISNGKCIERQANPENYIWFEGGVSSQETNITSRNKFDIKLRIQATRNTEEAPSEEE